MKILNLDRNSIWYAIISSLFNAIMIVGIIVCLIFIIFSLFYSYDKVEGTSMQPYLNTTSVIDHDHVYTNKLNKGTRGDVVVIKTDKINESTGLNERIIKRIIAVSGDRINLKYNIDNKVVEVFVNGNKIEEDYVKFNEVVSEGQTAHSINTLYNYAIENNININDDGVLVGENQIYVMGDNRQTTQYYGLMNQQDIDGKVELVVYKNENNVDKLFKYFIGLVF